MNFSDVIETEIKSTVEKRKFDINQIRADFPILSRKINGKPLIYLDNAATTQKPDIVIESIKHFYSQENANIHRGVYYLSELATNIYETARVRIKEFINSPNSEQVIFTKGTTDGINLLATSMWRSGFLKDGDEVIVTEMEHHANIVPWQLLGNGNKVKLKVIPMNENGELIMEKFEELFSDKTKLVSVVHTSNALGTINPVEDIIKIAHGKGVPVLIDAAQSIQHSKIDVQKLDCDFLVFSGHKIYGPTGIGILYGKEKYLNDLPPYQGGGDMIRDVSFERTTFSDIPTKFEAGTPNIAGGIGLAVALKYFRSFNLNDLIKYENSLLEYATDKLLEIEGLKIIGTADKKTSVISFVIDGLHPFDIGTIVDTEGVAIRTGHHCAQPIMKHFNVPATARASFGFYNTKNEIDSLIAALHKAKKMLR